MIDTITTLLYAGIILAIPIRIFVWLFTPKAGR